MRDAAIDTHRSTARGAGRSRTAGAPPLDDMVGEGPVSRGAPRRGGITSAAVAAQRLGGGRSPGAIARARRGPGLAARLRARLPRIKPLKALTVAAFGVALVGIVANAMVFQRGHHPSPLFGLGRSIDGASDAPPRVAAAVPAPPAPVERTGTLPPPAPVAAVEPPPAAAAPAPKAVPPHHAAVKPRHEPAAKVKAGETAPAHPRPGHPTAAHAKAEPPATPRAEPKPAPKADPVANLLAGAAHPARAEAKPAHVAQPAAHLAAKAAAAAPHHRVAATAPAEKPTAQTE